MAINAYVSASDVDERIGADWRNGVDAERAIMLANLWLSNRGVVFADPISDAVKQAGVELVKLASSNKLYTDIQTGVLSETVQADSVSMSQSFSSAAKAISAEMQIIEALIKPYLSFPAMNPNVIPFVRF